VKDTSTKKQIVIAKDTTPARVPVDTTLKDSPSSEYWRRPQVERNGSNFFWSDEAIRYYGAPGSLPELIEQTGGPFPLVQSDESYGRESFLMTPRTSEGLASTLIDGVVPMNSILTGNMMTNYFPIEAFGSVRLNSGADGLATTGADYAGSDVADFTIERFRAPVPYTRVHYTQDLARDMSNFDGLFSINTGASSNLTLALHRKASGSTPQPYQVTFNPRTDVWDMRGQYTISKFLGELPHDSTMNQHKIDSIVSLPKSKANTLDFLLWGQYTTAFSGLNGGIADVDSVDIFDQVNAPVANDSLSDHRVRADVLAEVELPLLAEARTKLAAYGSYESRRFLNVDSTFPTYMSQVAAANRIGAMLEQPLALSIGDFMTSARVRGDVERIAKDSTFSYTRPITETRLSATASDSLALKTALRISLFGFARTIESNMSVAGGPLSAAVLPSVGFAGSVGVTDAISISASYNYSRDRATLTPTPTATYQLQNIGAWVDGHFAFSKKDSLAIHAGVLDRHEPEGAIFNLSPDSVKNGGATPSVSFSNASLHTQSATLAVDAYVSKFHWSSSVTYFPSTTPLSPYTLYPVLQGSLPQRFFGFAGVYYEAETNESNLRLVVGPRVRIMSPIDPQISYDPASDNYVYRGAASTSIGDSIIEKNPSSNLGRQIIFDFLLSAEVDRRAQVSMSFLNILGADYYNVALYPRNGFHWRIDVKWAFLD